VVRAHRDIFHDAVCFPHSAGSHTIIVCAASCAILNVVLLSEWFLVCFYDVTFQFTDTDNLLLYGPTYPLGQTDLCSCSWIIRIASSIDTLSMEPIHMSSDFSAGIFVSEEKNQAQSADLFSDTSGCIKFWMDGPQPNSAGLLGTHPQERL
jgi:hypothetical protein